MAKKAKFPKTVWVTWEHDSGDPTIKWPTAGETPSEALDRSGVAFDERTPIAEYRIVRTAQATRREAVDITE